MKQIHGKRGQLSPTSIGLKHTCNKSNQYNFVAIAFEFDRCLLYVITSCKLTNICGVGPVIVIHPISSDQTLLCIIYYLFLKIIIIRASIIIPVFPTELLLFIVIGTAEVTYWYYP